MKHPSRDIIVKKISSAILYSMLVPREYVTSEQSIWEYADKHPNKWIKEEELTLRLTEPEPNWEILDEWA